MGRPRRWTDEQLADAVGESKSIASVLTMLGLNKTGANYESIKLHCERLGLSLDHFTGQGWNVGVSPGKKAPLADVLVENSTFLNTSHLKKRLVKEGLLKNRCSKCKIKKWRGKLLSLHLDHRNGNRRDNRLNNLRLLCPNCHSQTKTYCRPKRK